MTSKRNSSIDIFRFAAVALVIIQHYGIINPRTTTAAMLTDLFSRIAVPFFFMVSGFFSWKDDPAARQTYLKKQALTITKTLAVSSVIIIGTNALFGWHIRLKAEYIPFILFFNEPGFLYQHSHMWYMLALIYVLLIALAVDKLGKNKWAYICVPLLLGLALGLDIYFELSGFRRSCFTRNFLLFGLPYFYIGQLLHRYQSKILSKLTRPICFAALLVSAGGLAGEAFLALDYGLAVYDKNFDRTIFVFLPLLGVCVFLLLLHFPNIGQNSFVARYARDASMIIYIIHHIVEELIKIIAADVWGIEMFRHVTARYFLILFFSSVIGFGYAVAVKRLRCNVNR